MNARTSHNSNLQVPRVLDCPHCGGQMNHSGRGRAPGTAIYLCAGCVTSLRTKELWLGQVTRTGDCGFGFIQLKGSESMPHVHFYLNNFVLPGRGEANGVRPLVGDTVLVLTGDDPAHALRVWRVVKAGQPVSPARNRADQTHRSRTDQRQRNHAAPPQHNGTAKNQGRRSGSITKVVNADWGFITEFDSGRELFVHRNDLKGNGRLTLGRHVSYLPAKTSKGWRACEVE